MTSYLTLPTTSLWQPEEKLLTPEKNRLIATTALDGRYGNKTDPLINYSSEAALIRARAMTEIEYYLLLANDLKLPQLG